MAPVHEFTPAYVPVSADEDIWASPETSAVHDENGLSKPPAGTLREKWIAEPDTVPDTNPRALTLVVPSVMVSVPETDVDVWVMRHVIWPGPDESEAEPFQVPLKSTTAGLGAVLGAVED